MADLKTKPNNESVKGFIDNVLDDKKREDCYIILKLMKKITSKKPVMWGPSIIGFGKYHYKYDSGREGDFFLTGFSPRKQNLTIYIMSGFSKFDELLSKLGKFKTAKSCLYIKHLDDINLNILEELIAASVKYMENKY